MTQGTEDDPDFDALPARKLLSRWVLSAKLRLETAAHFGGQSDSALDMPILRCAITGRPLLPGSSLAGALRAHLLDRLDGYGYHCEGSPPDGRPSTDAQRQAAEVFGADRTDKDGIQSPLIIFDTLGTLPAASPRTEVRDGVMIDTKTGIAADQKKYDFEVLPAGTTFDVRFDLLVPLGAREVELLALLCASLEGLTSGEIYIGLRRSRGLGEVTCGDWTVRRFDLSARAGWLAWTASDYELHSAAKSATLVRDAIQTAVPSDASLRDIGDRRERVVIDVEAELLGDLLIRSPNAEADGPDVMHLASGGRPIVSGTSVAGVLRAHALRIAGLVHSLDPAEAERRCIAPMFGGRDQSSAERNPRPTSSRFRVSERAIVNGQPHRVTRVAIDRFTHGVVPTALFDEQPHAGGSVQLRFELRNPREGEIGLLLLVLKDLLTGQLPIGGAASVGRGVLIAKRLTLSGTGVSKPVIVPFDPAEARRGRPPASDELNGFVKQFVQAKPAELEEGQP